MLAQLDAKSLGRLALACRAGRELVALAPRDLWRRVAAEILPARHPACVLEGPAICAALAAFGASQSNLRKGSWSCHDVIPEVLTTPKFAPNGRDFAIMVAVDTCDVELEDLFESRANLIDPADPLTVAAYANSTFYHLVACGEDGSMIPLVLRPLPRPWHQDWQWSSDGQSLVCIDIAEGTTRLHLVKEVDTLGGAQRQAVSLYSRRCLDATERHKSFG
ncbi:hypothetical protein WJX73_007326 [Symbiochloris irregularis]|uniref:F-box domain-containing protein n=1 Tax=Symbiochloris irregularis TaxID=706552 RepID=A0AAW1P602_9CHLO